MAASRRCNLEAVGQLPASHPTLNAIRSDRYLAAYGPQLPTTKPVVTELFSGLSLVKNGNIFSEGRRFSAENIQEPTGVISREGRSVAKTRYWRAFSLILCRSQKIPDWMAGDAVVITPVSPQIPLLTGKFNRNFAYLARERLNPTREASIFQQLPRTIPCKDYQGNISSPISILRKFSCRRVSVHFPHSCLTATDHDLFSSSVWRWREQNDKRTWRMAASRRGLLASSS
jgi:hypothetical protein